MSAKTHSFSAKQQKHHELIEAVRKKAASSGRTFSYYVLEGLALIQKQGLKNDSDR